MSNVTTTNYITTFLQIIIVANFLLVLIWVTNNISFLFTNNHAPHQ